MEKKRIKGRSNKKMRIINLVLLFASIIFYSILPLNASQDHILKLSIKGTINPVVNDYVNKGIKKAADEGAVCVIIQMDTPGGLDTAMRGIIQSILNSPVPVVVYVSPSGARAASAGVLITMAGHIAAMAPGTNIGAAHPVGLGGGKMDETMLRKVENDAAAYAKTLAEQKGRNVEWAVSAVRESASVSAQKALELKVIDLMAGNVPELIEKIEGREVKTVEGTQILTVKGLPVKELNMGWRDRFLDTLCNPNIAYLLLMGGILGLFFELSHPGVIFPGVFGGICLLLAFFSLQTLSVNYAGILLILLAIILFIAEIKVTSYGILTLGGIIAMTLGSMMLFESPGITVSLSIILPVVITTAGFFLFALSFALKAQMKKPTTGKEGLIGMQGKVVSAINPEGKIFVHGEYWNAESEEDLEVGASIEVVDASEMLLKVKRLSK